MHGAKQVGRWLVVLLALAAGTASAQTDSATRATDTVVDLGDLRTPLSIDRILRKARSDTSQNLSTAVKNGTVEPTDFRLDSTKTLSGNRLVIGDADIHGTLDGNLVTLDGDVTVRPGGAVRGDVLALGGTVDRQGSISGTVWTLSGPVPEIILEHDTTHASSGWLMSSLGRLARVAGFITCTLMLLVFGLALVLLAPTRVTMVASTVRHSFARSFLVGVIGQMLLLPTFGILVVGLFVSIVGWLLLPFVVPAYILLAMIGTIGGYLVAGYAGGWRFLHRQTAEETPATGYRPMIIGLAILASPWLGWALFSGVPVVGALFGVVAFCVTWLATTVGFGAMLLSRGGQRATFAGVGES